MENICSYCSSGARAITFHNFQDGDGGHLGFRGQDDPQTPQLPSSGFLMPEIVENNISFVRLGRLVPELIFPLNGF